MKRLGISDSLRRASFNTALLHAAQELLPADVTLTLHDLHELPLFDQDVEEQDDPAPVTALKQAIDAADVVLRRAGAIVAPQGEVLVFQAHTRSPTASWSTSAHPRLVCLPSAGVRGAAAARGMG